MTNTPYLNPPEIDESIRLTKPLLHHAPTLSLRQDLFDLGVYVMSHWVVEFCLNNKRISSVRTDLIPYLINRQFQPAR
jgi:translation initiation factor eIF-2B subunit gamma